MGALAAPRTAEARPWASPRWGVPERRQFSGDGGSLCLATSGLFFHPCECGIVLRLCHMIGEFWTFLAYARLLFQAAWPGAPVDASLYVANSHMARLGNYGDEAFDGSFYAYRCSPSSPCSRPTPIRTMPMAWRFRSPDAMTDEAVAGAAGTMARLVCKMYREPFPRCYDRNGRFAWRLYERLTAATPRRRGQ